MTKKLGKNLWIILFQAVLMGVVILAGCGSKGVETAVVPSPTPGISIPAGVVMARNAVLEFLRTSANMCVPPAGVTWQASTDPDKTPEGFGVYRFTAEGCSITVAYALSPEGALYSVSVSNPVTGFCWEALVDGKGSVVRTGSAAHTEPEGNPAAIYCAQQGNEYKIITTEEGAKCGACFFPDGSACKGWDYFFGECQQGENFFPEQP